MKPFYKSRLFWSAFFAALSSALNIFIEYGYTLGAPDWLVTIVRMASVFLPVVIMALRLQDERQANALKN